MHRRKSKVFFLYFFDLLVHVQHSLGKNIPEDEEDPTIHNMVAVGDCRFPIRLEGLSIDNIELTTVFAIVSCNHVQYEPELFSGLIYHMKNPKVVLLIFVSGKVVVTGAKVGDGFAIYDLLIYLQNEDQIREAFDKILPILNGCRKEQFSLSSTYTIL